MNKKFLWRISVVTSIEAEEAVMELLAEISDQPVSSFTDAETKRVVVSIYFPTKPTNLRYLLAELRIGLTKIRRCGLNPAPAKIFSVRIPRESWAHSWKRHFKPLEIGKALLIKPSWIRRKPRKGQAVVVLDPGLSFGTGQHPTTGFCLRQIANKSSEFRVSRSLSPKNRDADNAKSEAGHSKLSFLDIGTGSGILAISAAKLGFSPVIAFDFDPEAVRIACTNARKNGVSRKLRVSQQDLTRLPVQSTKKYDVICANLISTLLIAEPKRIISRLKRSGILILAGILEKEFAQVKQVYEANGLKLIAARTEKEWRSGAFKFAPSL